MRIGGLASGMDTQQIISDLMKAERMPLDKVRQRKQTIEWQRDAYRDMNLKLSNFRESMRAKGLALQSTFLQKSITSSNSNAVTAVAAGNPPNVSTTLQVHGLATAATWVSNGVVDENLKNNEPASVWSGLDFEDGKATISFEVTPPGEETRTENIVINSTDKMADVMKKFNSSGVGVSAFYDTHQEKVVLSLNQTGKGANIKVTNDDTSSFMLKLGFGNDVDPTMALSAGNNLKVADGTNADFSINGFRTERTSNTFTINEMSYTLKEVTTGPVTISSKTDTDKIYDSIMKFVEDYNSLIDDLNGKLKEDRFRDYQPLTDDQKEAMSEKDIERWEEKAMSGLLRNDSILSTGLTRMRSQLYGTIKGDDVGIFKHLSQIGLVSSKDYLNGGKIEIDTNRQTVADGRRLTGEERLREAIEKNPEDLYKLFMADGPTMEDQGIIRRLRTSIDATMEDINKRAGREGRQNHQFTLGREMTNIDDRISRFERRLTTVENRYWTQFTALEKAMQQMNTQAEQMFSMLFGNQ